MGIVCWQRGEIMLSGTGIAIIISFIVAITVIIVERKKERS